MHRVRRKELAHHSGSFLIYRRNTANIDFYVLLCIIFLGDVLPSRQTDPGTTPDGSWRSTMANAMFISRKCGSPCGKLHLNVAFRDAVVPNGCMITWEDHYGGLYHNMRDPQLLFYSGAKILITPSLEHSDGSITLTVRVEAPSGAVLEDAIAIALERIGGVVEHINPPLTESFVRGVRNDLLRLKRWFLGAVVAPVLGSVSKGMGNFARRRLERLQPK